MVEINMVPQEGPNKTTWKRCQKGGEESIRPNWGAFEKSPSWRQTRTCKIEESWWAEMARRGNGIPGQEDSVSKSIGIREKVCSGKSSWYCVAGKGRANGKMWRVWLYEYWMKYFWNKWLQVCGGVPLNVQLFLMWMPAASRAAKWSPFSWKKI